MLDVDLINIQHSSALQNINDFYLKFIFILNKMHMGM